MQMRSSSKKPSDYLNELPPLPETRFKVRCAAEPGHGCCSLRLCMNWAAAQPRKHLPGWAGRLSA